MNYTYIFLIIISLMLFRLFMMWYIIQYINNKVLIKRNDVDLNSFDEITYRVYSYCIFFDTINFLILNLI